METLKSIDLFAGIGGIRLGFEQAFGDGIETVFVSEMDRNATRTYAANFSTPSSDGGETCDISGDITLIPSEDIPPPPIRHLPRRLPMPGVLAGRQKDGIHR